MSAASRTVLDGPAPLPSYTMSYGDHPDHVADVWVPVHGSPAPTVLLFHGGFWRHQWDRLHLRPLAAALAEAGYVVATPEYRRTGAPGGGWPGTFDDVRAAVATVPGLIDARTPTDGRLVLSGHSAGGHLALWAGLATPGVSVVALAPVADLRAAYELDLDGGAVAALLGGSPSSFPDRYDEADPLVRIPVAAPVVVVHGIRDAHVPPEFAQRYARAASSAGGGIRLYQPDADHFEVIDPDSPAFAIVLGAFAEVTAPSRNVDDDPVSR